MAFAELWLPIIGAGICIAWAIGAWYGGNKYLSIWLVFLGAVCLLLLGTLQWQHAIEKSAHNDPPAAPANHAGRAYVLVSDARVNHVEGKAPTMIIVVMNSGQTPAYEVTWRATFMLGEANAQAVLDYKQEPAKNILGPNATLTYEYTFPQWNVEFDEALKAEKVRLIAVGEIRYKDVSKKDHFTDYRLISGGRFAVSTGIIPGRFSFAPTGNNAD